MGTLWHDVRYGLRTLIRSPGFSLVIVGLVALGVGASATVFGILNPLLIRPLPYEQAGRIVYVQGRNQQGRLGPVSYPDYLDWQQQVAGFEELSCYMFRDRAVRTTGNDSPEECSVGSVSAGFFRVFSLRPMLGRFFQGADDRPGAAPVAVISHALWQRLFAADPNAVGQPVLVAGSPHTIIGVTPAGFRFLPYGEPSGDVWVTVGRMISRQDRGNRSLHLLGKLKAGMSVPRIQAQMDTLCARLAIVYPSTNAGTSARVAYLHDFMKTIVGSALRQGPAVLMGTVLIVFLVACANALGLMLARGVTREREMALRSALGGTRPRLVRLMLLENAVLALLGGGLGVLGAMGAIRLLLGMGLLPAALLPAGFFRLDWRVLGFALGLSTLAVPMCALLPALRCSGARLAPTLATGGRSIPGSRGRHAAHTGLLAAQVALTVMLLVAAGLMMRSLVNVVTANRGFDPEGVLVVDVRRIDGKYPSDESNAAFHRHLLSRLESLPGVARAGLTWPLSTGWSWRVYVEGEPVPLPGEDGTPATYKAVSPGYFETMSIPLLRGRGFDERDRVGSPPVVIVDEILARRHWPDGDWIGRRVKTDRGTDPNSPWAEVVGVVGHVKNDVDADTDVQVYKPILQDVRPFACVVLRSKGDPGVYLGAVKDAIGQIDPGQLVSNARTLKEELWYNALVRRLVTSLIAAFAAGALFLSAAGLYAATRYSLARRTQEFGIRMALGADKNDVFALVLRKGMLPVLIGAGIGLAGAAATARVLRSSLYQLSPWDPVAYGMVALLLVAVALLACYLPARRAARIDPMVALRYE